MRKNNEAAPDMIGLRDYCRRIGRSYTKCYEDARADQCLVPVYKSGSRWMVSRLALEALLHRQHDGARQHVAA